MLATPLPVTAGGILLAEQGPTLLALTVLTVACAAGGACLAGAAVAMSLAAVPDVEQREQRPRRDIHTAQIPERADT